MIGVLADHPRRNDVRVRLIELDPRNAAVARASAREADLCQVEIVTGDASLTDAYVGAVPADLVLMCGIFGGISDEDVETTVRLLPQFCAPQATVIWTRGRRHPDLTPRIRGWFSEAGFEEVAFESPGLGSRAAVGMHELSKEPIPLEPGRRLFRFRD